MKKSIIAASAAVLITAGVGYGGFLAGKSSAQDEVQESIAHATHQVMKLQEAYKYEMAKLGQMVQKMDHTEYEVLTPQVTERFKITSIDEQNVKGELFDKNGEGFHYSLNTFESFGLTGLTVNDIVDITWSTDAYNNSEWDSIEDIEIIEN